eukprot:TRINITY_DN40486_c0_g1_i1.p1 TRINITY_DN40486_c0_g1~~TRINITY_DN40486_c0_g1_i1.p1  ORF type:complete len:610 (+),score=111.24 TRINITY_DN40486_c0_g1_i1:211-2040(+)
MRSDVAGDVCRDVLSRTSAALDRGHDRPAAAASILATLLAAPVDCRDNGYWWLLRGWAEQLSGQVELARAAWAKAVDLYVQPPADTQRRSLSALVDSPEPTLHDFGDLFATPVYRASYHFTGKARKKLDKALYGLRDSPGKSGAVKSKALLALANAAAVDFARRSLSEHASAEQQRQVQGFRVGIQRFTAVAGDDGLAAFTLRGRSPGPYLTGLYLAEGSRRPVCIATPHASLLQPTRLDIEVGTLLLFHSGGLLLGGCPSEGEDVQFHSTWLAFDMWLRSPFNEEAGDWENNLKFVTMTNHSSDTLRDIFDRLTTSGQVLRLWPRSLRVQRWQDDLRLRQALADVRQPAAASADASDANQTEAAVSGLLQECEGEPAFLELPAASVLRGRLLQAAASYMSRSLNRTTSPGELRMTWSRRCRLAEQWPQNFYTTPGPAVAIIRGVYVATPSVSSSEPSRPLPIRLEVAAAGRGLGVHSEGFGWDLDWPFALSSAPFQPRVPEGSVLLLPADMRLSVLPFAGGDKQSNASVVLFEVAFSPAAARDERRVALEGLGVQPPAPPSMENHEATRQGGRRPSKRSRMLPGRWRPRQERRQRCCSCFQRPFTCDS